MFKYEFVFISYIQQTKSHFELIAAEDPGPDFEKLEYELTKLKAEQSEEDGGEDNDHKT